MLSFQAHCMQRLRVLLNLQPGEERPVLFAMVGFALLVLAFLLGRTVRDAMFLARHDVALLPWMYVGTAVTVAVVSRFYRRLSVHVNARVAGLATLIGFAVSFTLFRLVITFQHVGIQAALYLWVEVYGAIALTEFWALAGQVFEPRQAKRLFGLVSAGQVGSNLLCGALASSLSRVWGVANLLWLIVTALVLVIPVLAWLDRCRLPKRASTAGQSAPNRMDPLYRRHLGYLRGITGVVVLTFLTTSIIDFQFKSQTRAALIDENAMAAFLGVFYGAVGVVSFFLQTFFTGRIAKRFGVVETLAIMPAFFVLGSAAQVVRPSLATATTTKFFENGLRYSLNDPVTQLLYLPLPAALRVRALAFASGVVKPAAMGAAGLLMLVVQPYVSTQPRVYAVLVILLSAVWLAVLIGLKRGYLGTVASGAEEARRLTWQRVRLDSADPNVQETILRALRATDARRVESALALAARVDVAGLEEALRDCLRNNPHARPHVLTTLERRGAQSFRGDVLTILATDTTPEVQAAGLRVLASIDRERALPHLRRALSNASNKIRVAALEAMALYCGAKGLEAALFGIGEMLAANDPQERLLAVRAVGSTPIAHPFAILESLLTDEARDVKIEVIKALASRADVAALPTLAEMLRAGRMPKKAAEALATFDVTALGTLSGIVTDPNLAPIIRRSAIRALVLCPAHQAGDALVGCLKGLEGRLREYAVGGLLRKVRLQAWSASREARRTLEAVALETVEDARRILEALTVASRARLLEHALHERLVRLQVSALQICAVLWPKAELIALCREAVLSDDHKRQLLLEVLDNTIAGPLTQTLVPLLEGSSVLQGSVNFEEVLVRLTKGPDAWLRMCAVYTAQDEGLHWIVREIEGVADMMHIVEKVLLLKSANLFRHLAGDEVEIIAGIAHECSFEAGSTIFKQGDEGDALYIIVSGQVRVHIGEKQIAVLHERECFGEMAILDDQPRSASVSAITPVTCLTIRREDFFFLLEDHFEIVRAIIRVLTERLRTNLQQVTRQG